MFRRFVLPLLATAALTTTLALPAAAQTAEPQGPDFTTCTADGADFGACVAEIARAFQDAQAANGAETATAARAIVDGCAALEGAAFGLCVSTAAQALRDDAVTTADAQAADVAALAQALVDDCQAEEGADFGACVAAAAQKLGDDAGQSGEHGPPADPSSQGVENQPEGAGRPEGVGRP